MKRLAYSLFACAALSSLTFAGQVSSDYKSYKGEAPAPLAPEQCFGDTEFQLDLFGSYTDTRGGGHNDEFGGGVGANFFFVRYIGIGADVNLYDGGVNGVWNTTGSLILRYPLELGTFCIAPYLFAGGGGQFNNENVGTAHAGAGLEFRLTRNIGIYSEGRYTWTENKGDGGDFHFDDDGDDDDDFAQARLGLRFVF